MTACRSELSANKNSSPVDAFIVFLGNSENVFLRSPDGSARAVVGESINHIYLISLEKQSEITVYQIFISHFDPCVIIF